jgi:predicted phosphodiesterase
VLSVPEGAEPYPELMNRCAIAEIVAAQVDAVVVKGDLTSHGTMDEYDTFRAFYEPALGDRLTVVRGNHESYHELEVAAAPCQLVEVTGLQVAVIDTSLPRKASGGVTQEQVDWLGDVASSADVPTMVLGHHHAWDPGSDARPDNYFGIHPDSSELLVDVVARHPRLVGYAAGHTHRNRVRRFEASGDVPWIEVASVKDFPGAWAEYRVFEGGVLQVMHRISDPEALAWTDQTRAMYDGAYTWYAFGELDDRCLVVAQW